MTYVFRTRCSLRSAFLGAAAAALSVAWVPAACGSVQVTGVAPGPAPIERRPPAAHLDAPGAEPGTLGRGPRGEHLAEWMNQHSNLSPQQQQQALEHEPGFRELPPQKQQRMRERLTQLDAMAPQQRQRLLARNEAMERLNPDQRAEVRGAMSQLGGLPVEERRAVARTFRSLRELPAEQRVQAYASGRYGPLLPENQRAVLFNLLRVEPMLDPMLPRTATPPAQAFH